MADTKKFKTVDEPTEEEKAIDSVMEEADKNDDVFVMNLKTPFEWEGKKYERLTFNWTRLTGRDSIDVEREMTLRGRGSLLPEASSEFQMRIAARACMEGISFEGLRELPLNVSFAIQRKARGFLLNLQF